MQYPETFASTMNDLKERAETRLLVRYGTVEAVEKVVKAKMAEVQAALCNTDVDVVFLIVGSFLSDYVSVRSYQR